MKYDAYYKKIDLIKSFLTNQTNFAFVRFGDGELGVIDGKDQIRPEWKWLSCENRYKILREELIQSLQQTHLNYYIGIEPGMADIVGHDRLQYYYNLSGQNEKHILTANLFVNQNYLIFRKDVIPLFNKYTVFAVCQENSNIENLPFPIERHFFCHENAWEVDYYLKYQLTKHAIKHKGCLYLFMAGPFSNILIHNLHKVNQENIYLDIGSPLDPFLFNENTRGYLRIYNQ